MGDSEKEAEKSEYRAAQEKRITEFHKKVNAFDPTVRDRVVNILKAHAEADARPPDGTVANREPLLGKIVECWGGNPLSRAEDAVLLRFARASGLGWFSLEGARIELDRFKAELLGPEPTAIEKILVDSIGLTWVDLMLAEEETAKNLEGHIAVLEYRDRKKARATKRLHAGLRNLDLIRRKVAPAVAIQVNVNGELQAESEDVLALEVERATAIPLVEELAEATSPPAGKWKGPRHMKLIG